MDLKLYNTLTKEKEVFIPLHKKDVGLYTCGPTVYWYQHIGNLRSYIAWDLLKRVLKYDGYDVNHVMNVTDVGHLTSDADLGEDKMEKAALKEGKKAEDIANYYLGVFKDDFKKLNIKEPDIWSKATGHIREQIDLIKKLEKKGFTYRTKDGIYFDTSKISDYGKLARLKIDQLAAGKRVAFGEKKNITDFALWKFSEKEGLRQQEWPSPWGIGFPGWHIECSAMALKYLGDTIDIHTGGIDHIPVHHTNEIAQSEAATGKKFVNYWMHGAFLTHKGEKVSKSKGGLFTISELETQKFNPLAYRYFTYNAHYRSPLDFSLEGLEAAQNSYLRLKNLVGELIDDKKINQEYLEKFENAINDDLDMPKAIALLWELLRDKEASGKYRTIKKMDQIFDLDLFKKEKKIEMSPKIKKLIQKREQARIAKDWVKADEIREKIKELGFDIKDTEEGAKLIKI